MLRKKELIAVIEEGENSRVEFKQRFSTPEKIAKEIIAFANTRGGYMIFGVEDDGTICGVESEKGEIELINQVCTSLIEPPLQCESFSYNIRGNEVVVTEVPESRNKPHRIQDYLESLDIRTAQVYIRVDDKSVQAGKEMIRVLKHQNSAEGLRNYFIGDLEKKVFEYLEKNERIDVKIFCNISNISERRASRTLVKMVRAGLLFIHIKDNGEEYFTIGM
ncbi:MAG: ATP-binding protein [Ignavibacteriaceae bacterium]|nr:ATP-binding protein [Ignavibacteriaceae bacterium]